MLSYILIFNVKKITYTKGKMCFYGSKNNDTGIKALVLNFAFCL